MYKGEYFNSISHLVAAVMALVAGGVLITLASIDGNVTKLISVSVYSLSLFILYLCSTLYHSLQGRAKAFFQTADHMAIYLLIAGTYTPFALVALQGSTGWWLFCTVWALAVLGITLEGRADKGRRIIPMVIYLVMGWACVFTLDAIQAALSPAAFELLFAGGIVYTVGMMFYICDKVWPATRAWAHEVWHVFVIGGSVCHYMAIVML